MFAFGFYYRRDGTPYPATAAGMAEWFRDFSNKKLHIVRQDELPGCYVSTVWLGTRMGITEPPLIFETMAWDANDEVILQRRYATENDAIAGHVEIVDALKAGRHLYN